MINPNAHTPNPDINKDLDVQRSLASHLAGRIIESSRMSEPYGVGDDAAFGYASEIYTETQRKIAEIEDPAGEQLQGTVDELRAYIEEQRASGKRESKDSISAFNDTMSDLLVERLDGQRNGVSPTGYVIASELLRYDCAVTGINGFTHEPMPRKVTGFPPMAYSLFVNLDAVGLARGAFGDKFADAVNRIYKNAHEKAMQAKSDKPEAA